MFKNNFQINFIIIEFKKFDEAVRSFKKNVINFITSSFIINSILKTFNSSINFFIFFKTNFVQYEIIDLLIRSHSINVKIIKINFDQKSTLNKRAYMQKETKSFQKTFQRRREKKQPEAISIFKLFSFQIS